MVMELAENDLETVININIWVETNRGRRRDGWIWDMEVSWSNRIGSLDNPPTKHHSCRYQTI